MQTYSRVAQLFLEKSGQVLVLLCNNLAVKALHQAVGDLDLSLPPLQRIYSLGVAVRAAQSPVGCSPIALKYSGETSVKLL